MPTGPRKKVRAEICKYEIPDMKRTVFDRILHDK